MHGLRIGLKIAGWAVLTLAAVAIVFVGGLQTGRGKDWLAVEVNSSLSAEIQVKGLGGSIPWDVAIDEIDLRDAGGSWGRVERTRCKLRLGNLLRGRLTVVFLGADRIFIERQPQLPSGSGSGPWRLLNAIVLQRLEIPILDIAQPVLGTQVTLAVAGGAMLREDGSHAALAVKRIDGQPGQIDADVALSGEPVRLNVTVKAEDPSGQLLNRLLSRDDALPFAATLSGDGPLADWHGRLDAQTGGAVGRVGMDVVLSDREGLHAVIDGTVAAAGLWPASMRTLIGDEVAVHLAGAEQSDGSIEAEKIKLRMHAADISGTARIGAGKVAARLRTAAVDVAKLSDVVGQPMTGSAEFELTVAGRLAQPSIIIDVDGHDLRLADQSADSVKARFAIDAKGGLDDPHAPIDVSAGGRIAGLHVGAGETGFDWRLVGTSTRQGTAIAISDLTAEGAGLTLTAQGTAELDRQTVSAAVHLVASDLAQLSTLAGWPLGGRASLDGTLSGRMTMPRLDGVLTAEDIISGDKRLDRLTARLHTTAAGTPFVVEADGEFRSGRLAGTLTGRAALDAEARTLDLTAFHMAANGTAVEAAMHTALDTGLTSGRITARSSDLSPWSSLAGAPLSGRFDLDARLTAARRGQDMTATVSASQLALASVTAERVSGRATLSDLLGTVAGRGDLTVLGGKIGEASFAQIHSSIQSRHPGNFAVTADLRGQYKGPVTLVAAGDATRTGSAVTGRLATFEGSLAHQGFRLDHPLTFTGSEKEVSIADLALGLGGGRIDGAASFTPDWVTAKLTARNLPVGMAKAFTDVGINGGTLDADVDLHGPLERLAGDVTLATRGLRLATARHPDLPALDATAEMQLRDSHAAFTGRVARPKGESVDFAGGVVLAVTRHPFAVSIPTDGALSLRLQGDGQLEDLADLLPLGEDQLSGHYHIDLNVAGTIDAPAASGHATLDHGRYESLTYGTRLEDISIDLEGDRDRIVLRRFTAKDGDQGTASMAGFVLPVASGGPTLDATLELRRFQLVHRDDSLGHGSGDIQVTGPLFQPQVAGRLTIDDAQLYLADRLPPNIRPLAVTVIDSSTGQVLHTPPAPPHHPPIVATLEATIDIPGQFFIRGRGLDSEWTGHFDIGGTSDAPDIRGALKVAHGTMNFLGKPLELTRGTITLTGGGKVEPLLDFLAQSSTPQFIAQVTVTGSADQPTIKLTSDPPVPQDQVLSQLLFQRDVTQLSPLEALQMAQAAADLTNGGPSVIDRIRMKVGLDRLGIGAGQQNTSVPSSATASASSGSTASSALGNTMVSGGKYVAPGVFVGVGQGLSGESQVTVEVEITRHLTVSGTESDTTGSGVGLRLLKPQNAWPILI